MKNRLNDRSTSIRTNNIHTIQCSFPSFVCKSTHPSTGNQHAIHHHKSQHVLSRAIRNRNRNPDHEYAIEIRNRPNGPRNRTLSYRLRQPPQTSEPIKNRKLTADRSHTQQKMCLQQNRFERILAHKNANITSAHTHCIRIYSYQQS